MGCGLISEFRNLGDFGLGWTGDLEKSRLAWNEENLVLGFDQLSSDFCQIHEET